MSKTQLTQEGYDSLQSELNELRAKQGRLITQIEEVAQPDESGEDGLAVQLKDELEVIDDKIADIETALETAEIINAKTSDHTIVQVGSKVKIAISGKNQKEFHIVSHLEADPTQNKISDKSPLGLALVGRRKGQEIDVDAPVGKITYKIISIS